MRLRTVSCQGPGWRRVRRGRGFTYVDADGAQLPPGEVERVKALVIPPAWTDVWVCPDERGHLQAVGTDAAGRRQYLYHPEWRRKRDEQKFERVIELGRRLPRVRTALNRRLAGDPTDRATVVAAAVRLVDLGCFRLGSDTAADENGTFGLTTLQVRHVRRDGRIGVFRFVGKSGVDHEIVIDDRPVLSVVDALTKGRRADGRLLATRNGRGWLPVDAAEVNGHIRDLTGLDVTAKDFRTWKATTTVANSLPMWSAPHPAQAVPVRYGRPSLRPPGCSATLRASRARPTSIRVSSTSSRTDTRSARHVQPMASTGPS